MATSGMAGKFSTRNPVRSTACSMRLEDGGAKIIARGYVGMSLFGRSQTWIRQAR